MASAFGVRKGNGVLETKNIPDIETVDQWLYKYYDIDVKNDKYENCVVELELDIDTDQLKQDCLSAFDKYGWFGFANLFSPLMQRSKGYGGLSLVYNPNYVFPLEDVHEHTLGYPRLSIPYNFYDEKDTWFKMMEKKLDKDYYTILNRDGYHSSLLWLFENNIITAEKANELYELEFTDANTSQKNTYHDTYSFNHLTPAAKYKSIGEISNKFKRSIVRSRLATLNTHKGNIESNNKFKEYTWHRDCSWFRELRFNISVTAKGDEHTIQFVNDDGPTKVFKPGNAYVWDTDIPHAHSSRKPTDYDRINLIYAVSPWFDYDAENDSWLPNEFCQKKHPLDMLLDGDIIDMEFKNVHFSKATTH